ncbi:MAG TPA: amidohydrolase family protein [Terriglobales bacterium]
MKIATFFAVLVLAPSLYGQKTPILFHHVRVFDGSQITPDTDVLIENGKIKDVGANLVADNARIVDGTGKTLLPGLIDAHVHVHGADTLEQALIFGVTTEFDMMMSPQLEYSLKSQENDRMASFFSAGFPATVPGGHGTEYGLAVPTLISPSEAQKFVDARLREGSDYIKIMYTAGVSFGPRGRERPTLSKQTLAAVIAAAHERHRLAVVHIGSVEGARDAIEAGADGLAHIFHGPSSPKNFGQFVAEHHAFVIPTLSVAHAVCGPKSAGLRLLSDPYLAPYLNHENISRLKETFPFAGKGWVSCKGSTEAISILEAAGVPILAGTDAPNPGTTYGASLHGELELYVEAGLTPLQALIAATSAPAAAFHVADRGRIAPGLRADLLVVNGHPDEDIRATRNIVAIYKSGNEVDRSGHYHGKEKKPE